MVQIRMYPWVFWTLQLKGRNQFLIPAFRAGVSWRATLIKGRFIILDHHLRETWIELLGKKHPSCSVKCSIVSWVRTNWWASCSLSWDTIISGDDDIVSFAQLCSTLRLSTVIAITLVGFGAGGFLCAGTWREATNSFHVYYFSRKHGIIEDNFPPWIASLANTGKVKCC